MSDVAVSDLAYAHPGGDLLFDSVSFTVPAGRHAALVGRNGAGKTTLLKILAGLLDAGEGAVSIGGRALYMPQSVGEGSGTVRELLLDVAPGPLRAAGRRMLEAERDLDAGDLDAGSRLGEAIGSWSDLGGYNLEAEWDAACRRTAQGGLAEVGDRPAATLSGGERKSLVLDLLFASDAPVLLLDEPDNFLDVKAKHALEERIAKTRKTVLMVSHDREVMRAACNMVVTLEGAGTWVHGQSYDTYPEARRRRQERMGDRLQQWKDEERRLRDNVRIFKERARYSDVWAKKANAAETRHRHFVDAGPPPAPVVEQKVRMRLRGGDSARRVVKLEKVALDGLIRPFSDEVYFGERVGLIGPNGSGKTHLMRLLAGDERPDGGDVALGNRVSAGYFTQIGSRAATGDRTLIEVTHDRLRDREKAMNALARYGLQDAATRRCSTLSGGERARLEILCLEAEGHNLLLLDEPTDNLDVDSVEALESALDGFEGTVVAVSHDRAFLRRLDRYLLLGRDGAVTALPDARSALEALTG